MAWVARISTTRTDYQALPREAYAAAVMFGGWGYGCRWATFLVEPLCIRWRTRRSLAWSCISPKKNFSVLRRVPRGMRKELKDASTPSGRSQGGGSESSRFWIFAILKSNARDAKEHGHTGLRRLWMKPLALTGRRKMDANTLKNSVESTKRRTFARWL